MKLVLAGQEHVSAFVHKMLTTQQDAMPVICLLGGDRLACIDEAVIIQDEKEHVAGVVTIAPEGEQYSGTPTIVGLYVRPEFRRHGLGQILLETALRRCVERDFAQVHIDVMSAYVNKIIQKLPTELSSLLEVNDEGIYPFDDLKI